MANIDRNFRSTVLEHLSKYSDDGLFVNSDGTDHFVKTRKWQGISDTEEIYGMVDESLFGTGKFGVTFCTSGICWRKNVNDDRHSLLWTELPFAARKIHKKFSSVVLEGKQSLPSSMYSSEKFRLLLTELAVAVNSFELLEVDTKFKTTMAYVPTGTEGIISQIADLDDLRAMGKNIKSHPVRWGLGVFVLLLVFAPNREPEVTLPAGISEATVCRYAIAEIFGRHPSLIRTVTLEGVVYLEYLRPDDGTKWKTKCKLINGNQVMWASNNEGDLKRWRDHHLDSKVYFELGKNQILIEQVHFDGSVSKDRFDL